MSDRQKLFYALLASAFFHVAVGVVLAFWTVQHTDDVVKALPDLSQLTVTIMPQKPLAIPSARAKTAPPIAVAPTTLPPRVVRPVLDSNGLTPSTKAPANPIFQSDVNMVAGSQMPATGDLALPTQTGPNRKFTDFADKAASFSKGQTPVKTEAGRPAAQPAQSESSMPEQTPFAVTQVQHTATPAPIAQSTPVPTPKPAPTVAADTLALGTPTPTPAPAAALPKPVAELARLDVSPSLRGHADIAPVSHAPPSTGVPEPSMQRETEKTRINGGITAPGRPGVDAGETPFARYQHKLSDLIGSRWNLYVEEHPKDVGEVTIRFTLNPDGKVAATRVLANHAPDDLAELSTRAILESQLPPVPDDLAPMLRNGKLDVSFTFSIYDPHDDSSGR